MERLQKVIADSGISSRRKAEQLIVGGHVTVNGELITTLGTKVSSKDNIEVDGIKLSKVEKLYVLLNKPRGYITSTKDDKGRKTVLDLIETRERLYPVGRLDYDTTGLLLLTNDGDFANMMMHPTNGFNKTYIARVKGIAKGEHVRSLSEGIKFQGVYYQPAKVKVRNVDKTKNTSLIEITVKEGKNHQIKKMMQAVGLDVKKLRREKISFLNLKGLNSGDYRYLSKKEVSKLVLEGKKRS